MIDLTTTNVSTEATILDQWQPSSAFMYYFIPGAVIIMIVSGLGNTFCLTIVCRTSLKQDVDTLFIANLAVTDLISALLVLPSIIVTNMCYAYNQLSQGLCNFQGFLLIWIMGTSLFTTALISIDRCIAVTNPFFYRSRMTVNKAIFQIVLAWLVPFCYATMPLLGKIVGLNGYRFSVLCNLDVKGVNTTNYVYGYVISSYLIVGVSVTITCYIVIFIVAYSKNVAGYFQDRNLKKSIRTTSLIVGTNMLCWVPLLVLAIAESSAPTQNQFLPPSTQRMAYLLTFLNTAVNPILYTLTNGILRRKLKLFIHRYLSCNRPTKDLPRRRHRVGSTPVQSPRSSLPIKKSASASTYLSAQQVSFIQITIPES